jgi:predicted glycogen debranching enzyme
MEVLDTREWLLTNGLGSFASGTVCDAPTRTYHGWLIAALEPPSRRHLLLARLDATLELGGRFQGQRFELGTNFWGSRAIAPHGYRLLQSFQHHPVPTWIWGQGHWRVMRQIMMPHGEGRPAADPASASLDCSNLEGAAAREAHSCAPALCNRVLVHYRYEGSEPAVLKLRPLVGDRDFHHQQQAVSDLNFSQVLESQRLLIQALRPGWLGTSWQLSWTQGSYYPDGIWYWDYHYPEETRRGLGDHEDLFSLGCLVVPLQPGASVTLEARVRHPDHLVLPLLDQDTFEQAIAQHQQRLDQQFAHLEEPTHSAPLSALWHQLLQASDQFVVYRSSIAGPTVIAGYPWFNDWGRDTLIALPGLALTPRRYGLARGLLQTFGRYCQNGLIPNAFPDEGSQPFYNCIDAALWWIETLGLYLEETQDWAFLQEQYPTVQRIYKAFMVGTSHNIRVDAMDGLVIWDEPGVALTWMDAVYDGTPVTPRRGKPIEVNALWYSALCWAHEWAQRLALMSDDSSSPSRYDNQARRYGQQSQQVKASLHRFWNGNRSYFFDTIEPDDRPDPKIRPNAVLALSVHHCGFDAIYARQALHVARDRLLTPVGLRSLDPADPNYIGRYQGNVQARDSAYHQGTVWSWLIGPFCRAWRRFYPDEPLPVNGAALLKHMQTQACLGSISEIFDGDPPHLPQGAIAQAWSVAEFLRHWPDLTQTLLPGEE